MTEDLAESERAKFLFMSCEPIERVVHSQLDTATSMSSTLGPGAAKHAVTSTLAAL